jgi:hypothetical protein
VLNGISARNSRLEAKPYPREDYFLSDDSITKVSPNRFVPENDSAGAAVRENNVSKSIPVEGCVKAYFHLIRISRVRWTDKVVSRVDRK